MRFYTIKKVAHAVYDNIEECPSEISYKEDWRTADKGDWVLADDGCIIQVLRKGRMKRNSKKNPFVDYIGTCTGTFSCESNKMMDTEKRKNIYSFGGDKSYSDHMVDRKNPTEKEILFTKNLILGMQPKEAYKQAYQNKSDQTASIKASILLKTERIRKLMREEIKPVLKELNITPEVVLGGIRDIALDGEKDSDRLKALTELADILEIKDESKVTDIQGAVFQGFQPQQIQAVERPKLKESNGS